MREPFVVKCGDSLDLLDEIETATIDAVICDPPYMINTKSDGRGKLNPWADYLNGSYWYTEWMRKVQRVLKPTGCLWVFINWRSFVTIQKSACDLGWPIESVLVWDKCWIGPGGQKGLRPSYELVALFAMSDFLIKDRGIYDIQRFKWTSKKPHGHPAEKPENLLRWIIELSTPRGGLCLIRLWVRGLRAQLASKLAESSSASRLTSNGAKSLCKESKNQLIRSLFSERKIICGMGLVVCHD